MFYLEVLLLNLIQKIIPPCSNCPYKLGIIKTLENPCPQCKLNNYQTYEVFQKQLFRKNSKK